MARFGKKWGRHGSENLQNCQLGIYNYISQIFYWALKTNHFYRPCVLPFTERQKKKEKPNKAKPTQQCATSSLLHSLYFLSISSFSHSLPEKKNSITAADWEEA